MPNCPWFYEKPSWCSFDLAFPRSPHDFKKPAPGHKIEFGFRDSRIMIFDLSSRLCTTVIKFVAAVISVSDFVRYLGFLSSGFACKWGTLYVLKLFNEILMKFTFSLVEIPLSLWTKFHIEQEMLAHFARFIKFDYFGKNTNFWRGLLSFSFILVG